MAFAGTAPVLNDAPPAPTAPQAASTLPSGFTMGTGDMYGASYYNGSKVIGVVDGPNGKQYETADGHYIPYSDATQQAIEAAANAGLPAYNDQKLLDAEKANPNLGGYYGALRTWAGQTGMTVDPMTGLPTGGFDMASAPQAVQDAYKNFTGNPLPEPATPDPGPARYLTGGVEHYADGSPVPGGYNAGADLLRELGLGGAGGGAGGGTNGNLIPSSGLARIAPAGSPTPGGPNIDPVTGSVSVTPGAPGAPGQPGTPSNSGSTPTPAAGSSGHGVSLTPTTIDNALTNYTISPDNTVDRVKLAQDALSSTIQNILDPQFQANERDANRFAFGAGRGVSGIARTSQGDIESDYNRQKTNLTDTLLNSAVNGSIDDLYRNIGIAQQQQGFQAGQQRTAFDEALQQLMLGSQGDPSNIDLVLAQIFGSGAGAAGQAASSYVASQNQQQSQQLQQQQFDEWLQAILQNGYNNTSNAIIGQGIPPIHTTPNSNVPGY